MYHILVPLRTIIYFANLFLKKIIYFANYTYFDILFVGNLLTIYSSFTSLSTQRR